MKDNVHTEEICSSIMDALPLDSEKYIQTKYVSYGNDEPMFVSGADSLEKAAE